MTNYLKIAALLILPVAGVATVAAQEIARGETVDTRPRPDYDAIGAPVGRFLLYPEVTMDVAYDDNIFAADKSGEPLPVVGGPVISDTLVLLEPAIALRSDWSRNALNAGGRVLGGRYNEYASQDFTDYDLWADGNLEFGPNRLEANVKHNHLHSLRTSSQDQNQGIFPTEYDRNDVGLGYRYAPGRVFVGAALAFRSFDYDNAIGLDDNDNPTVINNQDRDRLGSEVKLRLGYLPSPAYSVFLETRLYDVDYDTDVDRFGNNRDQNGYDIVLGSEFDMTGVTSGEVFAGYRNIDYDEVTFETQNGPVFGASVDWNITQLTTITFLGSQRLYGSNVRGLSDVDGTTPQGSSGIQARALGIQLDHELRRNFILSLELEAIDEDYLQITREDEVANARLGLNYFLTRNWGLNAGYRYQKRDSNSPGAREFRVNQFYLGIHGQI